MQQVKSSIAEAADQIRPAVDAGDTYAPLRIVADFIVQFRRANQQDRRTMLAQPPPGTGSEQWDALLAGVTEMLANRAGLPPPKWVMQPARFLSSWWFVSPYRSLHASALVDSPAELANRGVFIHQASLESV